MLGSGSWGTALAKHLADKGHRVQLWARRPEQSQAIQQTRENADYLPGATLPETLSATSDLNEAVAGADLVLSVVPTHGTRGVLEQVKANLPRNVPIVSATKGIENSSLQMISEVFADALGDDYKGQLAYLGGPSFAKEVAAGIPTAISIAAHDHDVAVRCQEIFATGKFRVYTTEDVTGVELGGALKNVVAIAAGVADGLGFGQNTRAALITRGLAEITRLAVRRGAHPQTMAGLSGMGDLVLTCCGDLSRNRRVGIELGQGKKLQEILDGMNMVAEGVRTAKSAYQLAEREGVDMPITTEVYQMLYEDKPPKEVVKSLMGRPQRHERE